MSLLPPANPNPNPPPPPPPPPPLQWHHLATGEVSSPLSDPLHPYRFQRSDQWKPVYSWLESLDFDRLVNSREITEWLDANPRVYEMLLVKHSRYHLMHYIQRLHLKVLKKKGKVHKGVQLSAARASLKLANGRVTTHAVPLRSKPPVNEMKDDQMLLDKKSEAFLRYELLTDLQSRLTSVLFNSEHAVNLNIASSSSFSKYQCDDNTGYQPLGVSNDTKIISGNAPHATDVVNIHVTQQPRPISLGDTVDGQGSKWDPVIKLPAWSCNEATSVAGWTGTLKTDQSSSSNCWEAGAEIIEVKDAHFSMSQKSSSSKKNIAICLQGREKGSSWALTCLRSGYAGRNREHWIPFLKGWRSLERQFEGPAVWFERRRYSSWVPTWCAYTSHAASAQPHGRQGVQRVLDVRFHPDGLPQLVCSCNEAPNELLLYNLLSGRAVQLSGHNCQIQAVEFAVRGASVVSCGANLLKVWDCTTGSCLFTLGSVGDDRSLVGHAKRINTMTVNTWQSCLVATSGGSGDDKVLLWNALRGELAADLNVNLRDKNQSLPSIDAMDFCNENLLACGSNCSHGAPAVVQLWDLESQSCLSLPAHDSFITSVKTDPAGSTVITGAGDGTVCLFDIRTCDAINRLSVGSASEVTSASFSSCGTYFHASSTSNKTMVWDTRLMPMNRGQMPLEKTCRGMHFMRPLHCLSHGKQMPTAEYSGQLPGHVDEGAQGVNDASWLYKEPVLVTVSGDGSIAMWDVTLGQPCVRHIVSHMRCANTVTVSANDEYLCSGGDDQKVVLYHNSGGRSNRKWRLSHPVA